MTDTMEHARPWRHQPVSLDKSVMESRLAEWNASIDLYIEQSGDPRSAEDIEKCTKENAPAAAPAAIRNSVWSPI